MLIFVAVDIVVNVVFDCYFKRKKCGVYVIGNKRFVRFFKDVKYILCAVRIAKVGTEFNSSEEICKVVVKGFVVELRGSWTEFKSFVE